MVCGSEDAASYSLLHLKDHLFPGIFLRWSRDINDPTAFGADDLYPGVEPPEIRTREFQPEELRYHARTGAHNGDHPGPP